MRVLCILLISLWSGLALAADDHNHDNGTIQVQAQGHIEAIPDTLTLQLSIKYTADTLAQAGQLADRQSQKVQSIALKYRVEKADIDSSRLSSWAEYEWRKNQRHYLGESVQREVVLKLRDLDIYGALMGELSALPLHRIHQPSLSHSNIEALKLKALRIALANGRVKAGVIADEIDARLGAVQQVRELHAGQTGQRQMMRAEAASADMGSTPVFSFARQQIQAQVEMVFVID